MSTTSELATPDEDRDAVMEKPELREFRFSGTGAEYFRIWIVNICLTIVTLGIYSAWAKVRRNKYLYRSTSVAAGSFDYHADPKKILVGRLVVVGMLGIYVLGDMVMPGSSGIALLVIGCFLPWLLVRSRMFNMRNTSFRNVRFSYPRIYREAYKVIFGIGMLLTLVTFGLAYPYAHFRRARMIVDNTSFGELDMRMAASSGNFYGIYIRMGLMGLLFGVLLFGAAMAIMGLASSGADPGGTSADAAPPGIGLQLANLALTLLPIVVYVIIYLAIAGLITKAVLDRMTIGDHALRCRWNIVALVFIQITNLLAIASSAGLLIPWATIRVQRYRIEHLALEVHGDLESIGAREGGEVSAMGEEIGDAFDFDFGI